MLGQPRSTQRKPPKSNEDEQRLTADIIELAKSYGRYGYRRIHALLGRAGWQVSLSVVERIWRREGLKVPQRQPKRRRLWGAIERQPQPNALGNSPCGTMFAMALGPEKSAEARCGLATAR